MSEIFCLDKLIDWLNINKHVAYITISYFPDDGERDVMLTDHSIALTDQAVDRR